MSFLKRISIGLFLLGMGGALGAQNIEYGVMLDTNYMLIGDQQQLVFKVKSDTEIKVKFPQLKDTVVSGVEIISGPRRDSVKGKDGSWMFEEKYVITVFDTGVYVIPSLPVIVEGENYNNVLRTDSVGIAVNTYQVDPQKGNYDIVLPHGAPWTFAEILPYVLWCLLGIAVLGLLWWLWFRYRRNRPLFQPKKEAVPPYAKAIRSLDEIREGKLWQAGREKEYYTSLTDTVRLYLEEEFGIPAMEQTSAETIDGLGNRSEVDSEERRKMAEILAAADFVKFARFKPLQEENVRYLDAAYDFVNVTHRRLQAEMEEREKAAAEEERKRQDEEKKEEAEVVEKKEEEK